MLALSLLTTASASELALMIENHLDGRAQGKSVRRKEGQMSVVATPVNKYPSLKVAASIVTVPACVSS